MINIIKNIYLACLSLLSFLSHSTGEDVDCSELEDSSDCSSEDDARNDRNGK